MSRTNKSDKPKNPAKKFFEWKSVNQTWDYYDKQLEQRVSIPYSDLKFIALDQLSTVKGYSKKFGGFWANEVRSTKDTNITVRHKAGVYKEGTWEELKDDQNLKFTKSIYVMAKFGDTFELCNLQLSGAAFGAWLEFTDAIEDIYDDFVIGVPSVGEGRNGAVVFHYPQFQVISDKLSDEAISQANGMDIRLQEYLKTYFAGEAATSGGTSEEEEPVDRNGYADGEPINSQQPF